MKREMRRGDAGVARSDHPPAESRRLRYPIVRAWLTAVLYLASPLHTGASELVKQPPVADAVSLLDLWIEEQRTYHALPGLSIGVVHDQELVWARGYGLSDLEKRTPVTPGTVFRIGSITKLFTATAIMQLRDAGELRLDDPVSMHLPWFEIRSAFEGEPEITVRHLLTHTSGLPREAAFPYWTTHDFPTREQIREAVPDQDAIFAPASKYKYSNLGMALLGEIVTAVSGEPWAKYLQEHVFQPLGMSDTSAAPGGELRRKMTTAYLRRSPDGSRKIADYYETRALAPAANIVSNVENLARFATLQFRDVPHASGAQILKASTLREMHRPHWIRSNWSSALGLGFRVSRRGGKTVVSHGGWVAGHRSHLLLVPAEKVAVIVLTNADDAGPSRFSYRAYDVLGPAITRAVTPPAKEKRADPGWQRFLGEYTDPWGWEYKVMILNDELVMYEHNYPPEDDPGDALTHLEPVAANTFRMSDGELVVFELGEHGKVVRVKRRYDYIYPVGAITSIP